MGKQPKRCNFGHLNCQQKHKQQTITPQAAFVATVATNAPTTPGGSPTAGMSSQEINAIWDKYQAGKAQDALAARRRPEVDAILSEKRQKEREAFESDVARIKDAYNSIPAGERPTLSDEQHQLLDSGRPRWYANAAGASTREEKEPMLVGFWVARENSKAKRENREPLPAKEVIARLFTAPE